VFVVRVFYVKRNDGEVVTSEEGGLQLTFKDFVPAPTTRSPTLEFQTYDDVIMSVARWMKTQNSTNYISMETIEYPLNPVAAHETPMKEHLINTNAHEFRPVVSSSNWSTIRFVRVWYSHNHVNLQRSIMTSSLDDVRMKTFIPYQVTTKGCFGFQKPLFATTSATVERIKTWMEATGATVVSIETDNVEKWAAEELNHHLLGLKAFNKEGYFYNWWRNPLDYRISVFRIYYIAPNPDARNYDDTIEAPIPAQPCCCITGQFI